MNGNDSGNKNGANNAGCIKNVLFWVLVAAIFFSGDFIETGNFAFIVLIAAVAVMLIPLMLILKRKRTGGGKASAAPERRTVRSGPAGNEYYDSDCMRASTGHDHDRRIEQLDAFLENGLITREEYALMQERYERLERDS